MSGAGSDRPRGGPWREWLAHAFAIRGESTFAPEDEVLLDRAAVWLVEHGLGEAAVLTLETCRPLNFLGAQAMVFLRPFAHMIFKKRDEYDRLGAILEDRATIGLLIKGIERRLDEKRSGTEPALREGAEPRA